MLPQRIAVKLFVEEPDRIDLPAFIPLFHRWIQTQAVEGLLVDVANYAHVHHGPGVLLIGHEGDYALDLADGRPGLVYRRKRAWDDDPAEAPEQALQARLRAVLHLALAAGRALESDPALEGRLRFRTDELEVTLSDRLHAPNTPDTLASLREHVAAVLAELYAAGRGLTVERAHEDPRRALTLRVRVGEAPPLDALQRASDRAATAA